MTVAVAGQLINSLVIVCCTEQATGPDSAVKVCVCVEHSEGLERICFGLFQDAV